MSENLQLQLQLQSQVMSDFCYVYAKKLYEKLLELKKEGIVLDDNGLVKDGTIAYSVVKALSKQISFDERVATKEEFDPFIKVAGEYLAMFEEINSEKSVENIDGISSNDLRMKIQIKNIEFPEHNTRIQKGLGWCDDLKTIGDLLQSDKNTLMKAKNMGPKCLDSIEKKLEEYGLYFGIPIVF